MFVLVDFTITKTSAQNMDDVDSSQNQLLADSSKKYLIPDLHRKHMRWTSGGNKLFTYQIGFAPILDYTVFVQDEDSKKQVSKQKNQGDIRSARVSIRGNINFKKPWRYFFSVGYNGLDYDPSKQAPWILISEMYEPSHEQRH